MNQSNYSTAFCRGQKIYHRSFEPQKHALNFLVRGLGKPFGESADKSAHSREALSLYYSKFHSLLRFHSLIQSIISIPNLTKESR